MKFRIKQIYIIIPLIINSMACDSFDIPDVDKSVNKYPPPENKINDQYNIIFLHHSTGSNIWLSNALDKDTNQIRPQVPHWFKKYNKKWHTKIKIQNRIFPQLQPYGWKNYPYDYYNIWVKNAGDSLYMKEPTLEILTETYDMIILKHCFPVSRIIESDSNPNINSDKKTLENYKLQYIALKEKMNQYPQTKFLIWTASANVKGKTNEDEALRAKQFVEWVKNEWDIPGDNIYLWDFHYLETEGGIYFKNKYAIGPKDSHPNIIFSSKAAIFLCQRIIDVLLNNGVNTELTGQYLNQKVNT